MNYEIIRSDRKSIAIQIMPDNRVLVRCPRAMKAQQIDQFVREKSGWIEKHLSRQAEQTLPPLTAREIQALADQALVEIPPRAAHFARILGVTYGRITIRNQRTKWGSCSSKGNLNFNCVLMLAPEAVRDYIIVHELCHRIHMDHSPAFWAAVEAVIPDWKRCRKWLNDNAHALIGRL